MGAEDQLLQLAREFSEHMGAVREFIRVQEKCNENQAKTNDQVAECLKTLTDSHVSIKGEVNSIKGKVAFAAACVGSAVTVAWNWALKQLGIGDEA